MLETTPGGLAAAAALLDEPLVVVDVGARWGFAGAWESLGDRCLLVGFEPDEEECERLAKLHRGATGIRFVPLGLGARSGMATLYLTRDRACSSLYPPSAVAAARHPALGVIEPDGTATIDLTTLDEWCAHEKMGRVDVLKVDTQGSELDILRGASTVLEGARAVEVEVEFNEIYGGAPLFGDVDGFLRAHGFELWRFRDLVHYSQQGAMADWQSLDTAHFDLEVSHYRSGAGQVFWANAFYLKTAVAHPEAGTGWEQLVRDACITGALGFFDLSQRTLELARDGDPDGVGAALEAGRAQAGGASAHGAASIRLAGSLKVDVADPAFRGGGWHEPEPFGAAGVRWSGPGRDAWVDLPVSLAGGTRVEFLVVAAMSPEISANLSLDVNGTRVPVRPSPHHLGIVYSGVVPPGYESSRAFSRVMVRTPTTIPWNAVHPGDLDDAERGVAVAWLRATSPESGDA